MKIYNTLSRKKDTLRESKIGIYVCGPTVYDEPHIGHARSAYIFDVIVKYLKFKGFKTRFVRNITDIDDKIIDRARREPGENALKEKANSIAKKYLTRYHEDMDRLGLERPDVEPKATDVIEDMIAFIKALIKRGYAYEASGNVYFDVRKLKDYGRLSGQSLDQMEEGARVALDKNKKDPLDFALWKASKEDEPFWESPWGKGRPGWHIECSVMSTKFLKKDFLIHGGGLDLVFPHHENEIAQTLAAGKKSAKYWIHNGLLAIEGQKMSKSLGNFISIQDFAKEYADFDLLKLLFLSSHYRHPVDYSEEKIREMARAKDRIMIFIKKVEDRSQITDHRSQSKTQKTKIDRIRKKFVAAMDDDFNTPKALAALFEFILLGNTCLTRGDAKSAKNIEKLVRGLGGIFGLDLKETSRIEAGLEERVEKLIKERDAARRSKDFARADTIRKELLEQDIILEDTKEGTVWRRKV